MINPSKVCTVSKTRQSIDTQVKNQDFQQSRLKSSFLGRTFADTIMKSMDTLIYFIFSLAVYIQISDSLYSCVQSIPTIAYVTSCPKNKTEWDASALQKNCESLAAHQNCTSADTFQYHCLDNQWQNLTLEICAPIFFLQGFCPKYNTDKKQIEENYAKGFECLTFTNGETCPRRYQSSDAYKYQRCYKHNRKSPKQTTDLPNKTPTPSGKTAMTMPMATLTNDNKDHIKTVFLVLLGLALACIVVYILWSKRNYLQLQRFCKTGQDEEDGSEANRENEDGAELAAGAPLLHGETVSDQQDPTGMPNSSSNSIPVLNAAPKTSRDNDDLGKWKSHKDTVSKTKSDDVPSLDQMSNIATASRLKPLDDTFLKQKPDKETNSISTSDSYKSNDGHTLKPVSIENIASTSRRVLDPRLVINRIAADLLSAFGTSYTSDSPYRNTKMETKKAVIDDPPVSKGISKDAGGNTAPHDSTALWNNPFDEDFLPYEFGKYKRPRPPPHVTKKNVPQNAPLEKKKAPPPPHPQQPRKS